MNIFDKIIERKIIKNFVSYMFLFPANECRKMSIFLVFQFLHLNVCAQHFYKSQHNKENIINNSRVSVDGQHSDPVPVEETPVCHEDHHQYARNIC